MNDFYPRKIVVEKSPGNIWSGRRLGEGTPFAPRGSRGPVASSRVGFTMDRAKFDRVAERWFPSECRVVRVHEYGDGNSETTTSICRRTLIDFNPDFESAKAFVPDLRQDARLANQDDPQIPFIWNAGRPRPLIDPAVVRHMDQTAKDLKQAIAASDGAKR
jgi:hypothetical protein